MIFFVKNTLFSHTWDYFAILSIGSLFCEKENWFVIFWSLSCKLSYFVLSLLCRGWFWSGGFVPYPSSERLICWLPLVRGRVCVWNPSSVRWIVIVWLMAYPSCVRWCLCASSERLYSVERGVAYSRLLYCPKSSVEVPCVGVLCGQVSGNPSVWRRGRRAVCSNLETYPCVSVWSIDSNSLSLLYCALHWFILPYHIYACVVCVCLTCV